MNLRRSWCVVICLSLLIGAGAQNQARAQLPADSLLTRIVRERVESGRSAGIILGMVDSTGNTRIVSWTDEDSASRRLDVNAVFQIGSITKPFVGILLAEMADRGEVRLDDPVSMHLPGEVSVPTRNGRQITLVDLSSHGSGLPNSRGDFIPKDPTNPYADYSRDQLFDFVGNYELTRDVGAGFEYSNLAVSLLGEALAHRAGRPFEELLSERVLGPLGMKDTAIDLTASMRERLVAGHDASGNIVPNWDLGVFAPAGGLHSTMADMLAFLDANLRPYNTPLEPAIRASHAVRRTINSYASVGLNWIFYTEGADTVVYHPGETGGYHSYIGFNPTKKIGVVILSSSRTSIDDIGVHLLMPNQPLEGIPEHIASRREVAVPVSTLARYAGEYEFDNERWTVVVENGKLFGVATMQKYQLHSESERKFFVYEFDEQYEFEVDAGGRAVGVVEHSRGNQRRARKVYSSIR